MVFKSERSLEIPIDEQNNKLGPGEYYPYSTMKKFNLNKEPFLTSSPRSKIEIKDTPGPGSYYHDETYMKYLKNLQSEKISKENDRINLLTKGKTGDIYFLLNTEKKGFNIKSKRFKVIQNINNTLGPGEYFKERKDKNNNKLKKLKENEIFINKKINIIKNNEYLKIPTIPSKENTFGFDILNNGELIQRQNPEMYKTFTGEKGDTVGPGSYEIEKPNNWLKTGTSWSKLRSVRDCNKNDFSTSVSTTNFSESKNNMSNNIKSVISGRNNKNYSQAKSYDLMDKYNNYNIKQSKKLNNKSVFNLVVTNCKRNNKKKANKIKTFESIIKNVTPGPGYYYNAKDSSSFKTKKIPELKQFFGSSITRFENKKSVTNSIGPGEYFKQEKEKDLIKMNKTSSSAFAPFFSRVKRFNFSEEKEKNPGPGEYYPLQIEEIKKICKSSEGKFGSNEIRFNNMYNNQWKNSIPGPGAYIPIQDKDLDMSKEDKKSNKKGELYNNTKNDLERLNNTKINNLVNNVIKEEDVPPIGLYNPEIVNSIDYKIKKKAYESRNDNVAFNSTFNKKYKKKNIVIDCEESNLGPGYYYRDKKKKDNKISAVFHLPEFKRNVNTNLNTNVGPGKYNLNSYNDWTKKSFNINFI